MRKPETLLKISNLTIEGFSDDKWSAIVSDISLELARGEVLGLIGESGAGKSTLGLAAMGYSRDGCRISKGSIIFDGLELTKNKAKQNASLRGKRMAYIAGGFKHLQTTAQTALRGKHIAYVAQSAAASFNPSHRLIDQYCEGPVLHKVMARAEAEKDAIHLYTQMQLPEPEQIGLRYPHQVSGGQLQRAMTAMAMSCRPDLIVFDEPTTALDVTTQIEVLIAIRHIVKQFNTAAIYITHDLAVVAQMADKIKVLLKGKEVEEARTETMLKNPQQDYTKSLWAVRSYQRKQRTKPSAEKPLVSVSHINAAYGNSPVLFDVSFDIYRKQTVAVVGESGSGKSTVARVITGLLPATSGKVSYNDTALPSNYRNRQKKQLRQIQMIYQMADTALNPKQRIAEIIGRPAQFYSGLKGKALNQRICELLNLIELEPKQFINRFPSELSGGQKQRIGIARALAAEPEFIICDEITSALDHLVAEGILKLLDKLQNEFNLSYLFITHDLATVKAIADEVVVMKNGKVIEKDSKSAMFKPPHHPYTELLLSSVPEMDVHWLDNLLKQREKNTQ